MKSRSIIQVPRSRSGRGGGGRYSPPEFIPAVTRKTTATLTRPVRCFKCHLLMPSGTQAYWSKAAKGWRHPGCRPKWVPGSRFNR